ncbi:bifunctional helix-turn-helix transcriptional regulator/GNAT family N-acetyltransferase [Dyadobacter arcticus]|uniref:DNA-binding MarR family transcriptional regulator/GNAT superfamily N-acetyltransferase n=1 Tax=Dyadobacter arcticus TaxID=1078754 RepID=A0ABX0UK05_9BACT|nr:bifunctional helix-turn-helix transcriptional regulator/GNAT family N-acetyltransferase [Dyadobacter arcticus]NIJ53167.1 DNA-binding MarR family transcriptional regulator/GNAT superfamily N-acetyltransferase [Dyadobacter arcticus]
MNIFNEIGGLAISTRLQRLSDQFRREGIQIYKANNIEFEPKWFPVIYALHVKSSLSILELSEEIGYAHPSTISLLKELEREGLVESFKDKKDERKRMVRLTGKASKMVLQMQPVWEKMKSVAEQITNNANNLLLAMDETEYQLKKEGFFDRYQSLTQSQTDSAITIIDYRPELAQAFYDLNYAWISEIYEVEPEDQKTLSDPGGYYLKDGGAILIAMFYDEPVGTCALKLVGPGVVELSKMCVSKSMRGKKIGDLLGTATLEKARAMGMKKVMLNSNRKGSAAGINLYRKLGFVEVPLSKTNFKRADIEMEIDL